MGAGGASDTQWVLTAITGVIAWLSFRTKLHPLWLLAAGSVIGLTGFGQLVNAESSAGKTPAGSPRLCDAMSSASGRC
jgi:chromate transport protein ChrA